MQIILWRHAEAEIGVHDLERQLTTKGHNQATKIALQLRKKLPENHQIWVSQALRSKQTAAHLGVPSCELPQLNPEADAQQIVSLFQGIHTNETVVIVGHQPWIGQICAFLLNQNWNTKSHWSVKKGGFWWFECQKQEQEQVYQSKLKLMLTP